jgi:hypothetical protein
MSGPQGSYMSSYLVHERHTLMGSLTFLPHLPIFPVAHTYQTPLATLRRLPYKKSTPDNADL